ncbi:MAG: hypothetical protein JKY83_13180 [Rhizobiaceae bacterium]|nr:hypothetical protein [Rhizobiaceae bacterium]
MWEILRTAIAVAGIAFLSSFATGATAQAQSTIINQNLSGFSLPGVQLPQGHDEVRAADGTTCRSAVSGSGAYLDVGIIGSPEQMQNGNLSHYGRIVIPLGRKPKRLDCSKLYNLEIQRLQIELRLMQMGLSRGFEPASGVSLEANVKTVAPNASNSGATDANLKLASVKATGKWDDDGWSTDGRKD